MANYYMMTDNDRMTFNEINNKVWVGWDVLKTMTASELTAYDNKVRSEMNSFLVTLPRIEGTRKAEVCAEACKRADAKEQVESNVVRVSFPKDCHAHYIEQSWFVYKDGEVWYQKADRKCKAKHEVLL